MAKKSVVIGFVIGLLVISIAVPLAVRLAAPPVVEVSPGRPVKVSGQLTEQTLYRVEGVKPGYMLYIHFGLNVLERGHFEVLAKSGEGAVLVGVDEIVGAGETWRDTLRIYFSSRENASHIILELDVSLGGRADYEVALEVEPRYDVGSNTDAGHDFQSALRLGALTSNKTLGGSGYLSDQIRTEKFYGMDLEDYYLIDVDVPPGELTVSAFFHSASPEGVTPGCEVCVYMSDGFSLGCAKAFEGWANKTIKFDEPFRDILYVSVRSLHLETYYDLAAGYRSSQPPPPPPEQPPTQPLPLPLLWILVILLILFIFWILRIKPTGKLENLNQLIEKAYGPIEEAARKVMRAAEPAPITPTASKSIAKLLAAVFVASSANLAAWILALALLPGAVFTVEGFYRVFTYLLLHANLAHLIGNLAFFLTMGPWVEYYEGKWRTLLHFWVIFNLAAVAAHSLYCWLLGACLYTYCIGASGAISGFAGYILIKRPDLEFIVLGKRMKAGYYLTIWFAYQVLMMFFDLGGAVAYAAHVGGFLAGVGVAAYASKR